jgi:hypothetical protein
VNLPPHKTKVLKKHAENVAFFNKRRQGAAKIATAAKEREDHQFSLTGTLLQKINNMQKF